MVGTHGGASPDSIRIGFNDITAIKTPHPRGFFMDRMKSKKAVQGKHGFLFATKGERQTGPESMWFKHSREP